MFLYLNLRKIVKNLIPMNSLECSLKNLFEWASQFPKSFTQKLWPVMSYKTVLGLRNLIFFSKKILNILMNFHISHPKNLTLKLTSMTILLP